MDPLVDEFRRHAIDYGLFTAQGDTDGIDKSNRTQQRLFLILVNQGKGSELLDLYNDVDPWVQLAAAAHTLEIDEARASAKLEALEKAGSPHISTDAKYTLEGWKNGTLRFLRP